ncbi:MAG: hypothetical protein ABIO70_10915 [Pseudomonadota bacterium]
MSEKALDRDTRRRLLLAAAISHLMAEQAGTEGADPTAAAWSRTGQRGLGGAWAWSPRSPGAWRLVERLRRHPGR